jgi:hypothetical protein
MISDFETACLHQKNQLQGWSKVIWMRWLLARQSLVSHFKVRTNFSEKEFN